MDDLARTLQDPLRQGARSSAEGARLPRDPKKKFGIEAGVLHRTLALSRGRCLRDAATPAPRPPLRGWRAPDTARVAVTASVGLLCAARALNTCCVFRPMRLRATLPRSLPHERSQSVRFRHRPSTAPATPSGPGRCGASRCGARARPGRRASNSPSSSSCPRPCPRRSPRSPPRARTKWPWCRSSCPGRPPQARSAGVAGRRAPPTPAARSPRDRRGRGRPGGRRDGRLRARLPGLRPDPTAARTAAPRCRRDRDSASLLPVVLSPRGSRGYS